MGSAGLRNKFLIAVVGSAALAVNAGPLNPKAAIENRNVAATAATKSASSAISALELISRADPNQASATAGALTTPQLNQRTFSDDGRYVVFQSTSENLIDGLNEDKVVANIFLHDRVANTTVLVSHAAGSATTAPDADSFVPCISGDGRFVVYWSFGSNVVPNQSGNGGLTPQVFIFDRTTGTNALVSHIPGSVNVAGDSNSYDPTISRDGRFVSFTSSASNLVNGQTNGGGFSNIFLWDRVGDTITLVSHQAGDPLTTSDGGPFNSVLSDDGGFVAFISNGSDLVPGQTQSARKFQVFLWNRATGVTVLVSHNASSATTAGNNASFDPTLNADASYIAFYGSATDLVNSQTDANQNQDVFVYERATGTITLVSHNQDSATTAGAMTSLYPSISADGRYVVYQSTSPDLVSGDLNNVEDVFLWDRTTNGNTLISRSASSPVSSSGNAKSFGAHISADGNTICFTSNAGDLLPGQTASGNGDIFFLDRPNSALHLISHTPGSSSSGGNDESFLPVPSANGVFVAFNTLASDVVSNDNNASGDVIIFDRETDTNTAASSRAANLTSISANGDSGNQQASADGHYVVFVSDATNLVPGQSDANNTTDVFLRDRQTGTTILVSHATGAPSKAANAISYAPVMSADGRWVSYASAATDLISGFVALNGGSNVYLYDRQSDVTTLVSHSIVGPVFSASDVSETPAISADGRFIVYSSYAADIVTGQVDSNDDHDVFLFDATTGTNTLVSHNNAAANVTSNGYSFAPNISKDGRFIAYYSAGTDVVPNQTTSSSSFQNCFLFDRTTNTNTLVDHQFGAVSTSGDGNAGSTEPLDPPVFSADGWFIAYASTSTNLVSGQTDTNADYDIFVFDRAAGTNLLVSHEPDNATATSNDISYNPSISADGRFISYRSQATNLVADQNDTNSFQDVFLFDRMGRTNVLVTHAVGQPAFTSNSPSGESPRYGYQSVSPDGRFVAFWSASTDLVPNFGDQNGIGGDVYLYERATGQNVLVSQALGTTSNGGNGPSGDSQHIGGPIWSGDSATLLLASRAADLISDDFNNREDILGLTIPPLSSVVKIISITRLANGHILLQALGIPNGMHTIKVAPDMSGSDFQSVATVMADANGTSEYEDDPGSALHRFYRITVP